MKGIKAERIKVSIGNTWESPLLHVLLTSEDNVIVARCLDFTVASHGKDEQAALQSLAEAIKEYVLTAIEHDAVETIPDPAHGKYWRLFNELEVKQSLNDFTQSLHHLTMAFVGDLPQLIPEIHYA